MTRRERIEARLRAIAEESLQITNTAEARAEGEQALTDDEQTRLASLSGEFDALEADLGALSTAEKLQERLGNAAPRRSAPAAPNGTGLAAPEGAEITGGSPRRLEDDARGFESFGEFSQLVHAAAVHPSRTDERLTGLEEFRSAASGNAANTGTGADGGFLIPPVWSAQVREHMLEEDSLIPRSDNIQLSVGNSLTFPADETTPWGSNGVRAYWANESTAATKTKPALEERTLRMHKLLGLVAVTEELLNDSVALSQFMMPRLGRSIAWKTNEAMVNGSGAGQPLGILHASNGALVTVAKETSQTADTIVVENVAKMWSRLPAASKRRAVWLINSDAEPQLITMTISGNPIWTPPGTGVTGAPSGNLLGRPILPLSNMQTVGDAGDIALVDWSAYVTLTRTGGINMATSMHLYFDAEETAFRASYRVDGQPWLRSPVTPANGSNTLSPFVTLAARA